MLIIIKDYEKIIIKLWSLSYFLSLLLKIKAFKSKFILIFNFIIVFGFKFSSFVITDRLISISFFSNSSVVESFNRLNTVAIKRNATTYFLTLKAYNSLTTYARTIILYLF